MPEFEHELTKTEVTWGLISVSGLREYLPGPSEKTIVHDDEGREYITKMHSSAARIDGLTDWYKNHPTAEIGDTVTIAFNTDKSIKLSLKEEKQVHTEEGLEEKLSAIEIVPSMEQLLEDFLEKNLGHLEKGLRMYYDEKKIPGRQYPTDIGTIDLLCVDNNKKFVIIEIKKDRGSDKTVGQITRYMGWVKENLANNKDVRGIIIVHEVDKRLEYSASVLSNVEIKYYKIDAKFVPKEELG
jgi:RecB family endonuclease NucS